MHLSLHILVCRHRSQAATIAALTAAAVLLLAPTAAQASTNYTWSGAAAPGTPSWSNGTNWEGSAPSGTVGTLTFPALTSAACIAEPATATCYTSTNDVTGLNVNAIVLNEGDDYDITGNAITLGAGGITATAPASEPFRFAPSLHVPITLGAPQTWTINGGTLDVNGNVTGAADTLAIQASKGGDPFVLSDVEVGAVTISGEPSQEITGTVGLGTQATSASLNGTNGNPVTVGNGIYFGAYNGTVGALTFTGTNELQVGETQTPAGTTPAGRLSVNGGATFDPTTFVQFAINGSGTTAGTDYSQLSASGAVNLAGAALGVSGGVGNGKALVCPTLNLGTVDTLVTTTGPLTGTFAELPNGTTTGLSCPGGLSKHPWVRINYTAHTVTATVVEAPQPAPTPTTTALAVSNATPAAGEAVTYTATVTPEALAGAEPSGSVTFLDGGTPIGTCSAQPLTAGLSFSNASCTVSYAAAGAHTITATYKGDATYAGSSSTAQTVTVHAGTTSGGGTPPPAPPSGTVSLGGTTVAVQSGGRAPITLTCTGTASCAGTLTLTAKGAKKGKKKRAKTTTIGTAMFSIPAGTSRTVTVTLNSAGRALLRMDHGRLNATLTILTSSPAPVRTQHKSVHLAQRITKARRR